MKITNELFEKSESANTAEEQLETAKAENTEITAEQASKAFAELHKTDELSDEELAAAAGGLKDLSGSKYRFKIGARVKVNRERIATIIARELVLDRDVYGCFGPHYYVRYEDDNSQELVPEYVCRSV